MLGTLTGVPNMKKVFYAVLGLFFSVSNAAADPLYGRWKTIPDDNGNFGHIKVHSLAIAAFVPNYLT